MTLQNLGNTRIGKALREDKDPKEFIPGPGIYKQKENSKGPQYTFPHELAPKEENFVPGPGNYENSNFKIKQKEGPKYGIGTGPKEV